MNTKTIKSKLDKISYIAVDKNDMDLDLIQVTADGIKTVAKRLKQKQYDDDRFAINLIINYGNDIIDYCNGILERYS